MKHTKAPWRRLMQVPGGECLIVADTPAGRVELATVHRESEYGKLPVNENSALILAAPRLLEGCKLMLAFMEKHHSHDEGRSVIEALRNGIAKAENA